MEFLQRFYFELCIPLQCNDAMEVNWSCYHVLSVSKCSFATLMGVYFPVGITSVAMSRLGQVTAITSFMMAIETDDSSLAWLKLQL
jgi:hypothetical protein